MGLPIVWQLRMESIELKLQTGVYVDNEVQSDDGTVTCDD